MQYLNRFECCQPYRGWLGIGQSSQPRDNLPQPAPAQR